VAVCGLWGVGGVGDGAWAQVELPAEGCFFPGQRFILRGTNPLATVGGGEVLDLSPDRPRRVTPGERAAYALRARGEPALAAYLAGAGVPVLDLSALGRRWLVAEEALRREAERTPALRAGPGGEGGLVWRAELEAELLERLRAWVARQPHGEQSIPYDRLGRELAVRSPHLRALLHSLLGRDHPAAALLRAHARLERAGLLLHPGRVAFTPDEQRVADWILERLKAEGLRPARIREYREAHARRIDLVDRVLVKLREAGRVVKVSPELMLHAEAAAELRRAPLPPGLDGVRAAEFGQALGLSRKYSIPYLEYLNREGVLRREGDLHYRA
jgi:selenocysteine-specific elongation factor